VPFVTVAFVGDTARIDVGSPEHEQGDATRIRVVLADDSVLLREGIASLLEKAGFEIVGQSGTAEDLLLKVRLYKPDIAIVDIKMPPTQTDEGLRAAKKIRAKHPACSFVRCRLDGAQFFRRQRAEVEPGELDALLDRRPLSCLQVLNGDTELARELSQRLHGWRSRARLDPRDVRIGNTSGREILLRQSPFAAYPTQPLADALPLRHRLRSFQALRPASRGCVPAVDCLKSARRGRRIASELGSSPLLCSPSALA
jgi:CheY-like chemotaxis protein